MIRADLNDLVVVSCLFPRWQWSLSPTRDVLVARDGVVLRIYWMPVLLRLDPLRADLFVSELNGQQAAVMAK